MPKLNAEAWADPCPSVFKCSEKLGIFKSASLSLSSLHFFWFKEWNTHVWKHWKDWKDDFPWLRVEQTGLGCQTCFDAGVKKSSWSKFRACRNVSLVLDDSEFNMFFAIEIDWQFLCLVRCSIFQRCDWHGTCSSQISLGFGASPTSWTTCNDWNPSFSNVQIVEWWCGNRSWESGLKLSCLI